MSETRFPILSAEQMSSRQKEIAETIAGGPRGGIRGPFLALIHQPELANLVQQLGEYLRYGTQLPSSITEMVILIVARRWTCQYEWFAHARIARSATDLPEHVIVAISKGETPDPMTDEQAEVHAFVKHTIAHGEPTGETYDRIAQRFGREGVLDLIALVGYYSMIAMVLNTSRIPLPEGTPVQLQTI
jgi:4-carboxymuconolactone decarboxylase